MKKFEIEETVYTLKNNLKNTILFFIISLIGIGCMGVALILILDTSNQVKRYQEIYEEKHFYSILDDFVGENEFEMQGKDSLVKLRKFLNLLQNSDYFDYYMMYDQSVYVENYKGQEANIYGYEFSANLDSCTIEIPSDNDVSKVYTDIKGFWIGNNVIRDFGIKIHEGEQFEDNDFILSEEPISVILGSNFADKYKVGDSLYINFVFGEREAKIKGILEEGSNLYYNGKYINLDRNVIMPIFINDEYNGKSVFRFETNQFYTLRNSGLLATKLSAEDVQEIISEYSKEAGFESGYYVTEYDSNSIKTFGLGIKNIKYIIALLVIVISIFTMIILCSLCLENNKKSRKYYSILMMNGCSRNQIYMISVYNILFIIFVAYVVGTIAVIIISYVLNMTIAFKIALLLFMGTVIFGFFPLSFSTIAFFRNDLVYYMKEEI